MASRTTSSSNSSHPKTDSSISTRKTVVREIPYWEFLRFKTHSIKKDVIENLDIYLEKFESNCIKNGIHIHWATDAAEARQIVLDIAQKNNVETVVKSKSLTTEEIHLNDFLEQQNIEALETDMGEYIVQLMEQIPSHLVIPALHLNRKDVGKLFQQKLGVEYTEDPTELLRIARAKLRKKFLAADMGISGVNYAIADPGCFVIVENESNAHHTISLPKIHVAVMGIEKIIPTLSELPYFLKVLGPSATSQKSSTYVNFIGGPNRKRFGEGPEQVHIVLLDNGRSKILADPQLRETLFCIRCGACLNACPIYQQVGGHSYGWVYMGPIGITLIPQYLGTKEGKYAPFLSSLCGACYENCPMRINLPKHLLKLRNKVVEEEKGNWIEKAGMNAFCLLAQHPNIYRTATWFPGKIQKLFAKESSIPAPGYSKERALGKFDNKGFRKKLKEFEKK